VLATRGGERGGEDGKHCVMGAELQCKVTKSLEMDGGDCCTVRTTTELKNGSNSMFMSWTFYYNLKIKQRKQLIEDKMCKATNLTKRYKVNEAKCTEMVMKTTNNGLEEHTYTSFWEGRRGAVLGQL
jgi:hypothetical protein